MDAKLKEALYLALNEVLFFANFLPVDNNILEFTRFQWGLLVENLTKKEHNPTKKNDSINATYLLPFRRRLFVA